MTLPTDIETAINDYADVVHADGMAAERGHFGPGGRDRNAARTALETAIAAHVAAAVAAERERVVTWLRADAARAHQAACAYQFSAGHVPSELADVERHIVRRDAHNEAAAAFERGDHDPEAGR